MLQLTKYALKHPVSIIMCLVTVVYFGFQSLMGAKIELTPEMDMPVLLMQTVYAGASPEDIEELIVQKQEDAISSLSDIDTVYSYSMDNAAVIMVQYNYGTDIDQAYNDLKKAMDGIASDLPDDANDPVIMEMDMNSSPVVTLGVSGSVSGNLYNYVENKIVPEFERIGSVGEVSISGGQKDYVRIELIPEQMDQYGLSLTTVGQIVGAADFTIPAGDTHVGNQKLSVSVGNDYDTVDSLKDIPIPLGNGNTIHLSDIANVYEAKEDAESIGRYNGSDIITLSIKKEQSSTAIDVAAAVRDEIESLKKTNPEVSFTIINDTSEMISDSINDVFQTVIFALILAMIVLWLFCGDLRASVCIGASLLVSVVLALIAICALGYSLNVISLTALVFGVGMMVDNSINILDGCFRAKETMDYYHAAVEGTRSMIGAIAGGTVTNCIVFVPLLMLSGLTGQLFKQLAVTVIICLTASLFSASTIVPLCFYMWHPQERDEAPVSRIIKGMQGWYRKHMPSVVPQTKKVFAITAAFIVISLFLATQLRTELMPMADEGIVNVTVNVKPGLTVDAVNEAVAPVEALVAADENVDYYLLTYGGSAISVSGGNSVSLSAYLKDDAKLTTDEVISKWLQETEHFENVTISMEKGSSYSTMSSTRSIEVDLQSTDYDAVKAESDRLVEALRQRDDVNQVHSSIENAAPILKVRVDPVKAQAEGLTPATIGSLVYANLSGVDAGTLRVDNEDVDITVEFAPDRYEAVEDIQGMMIPTAAGTTVPLEDLADIGFEDSPQQIYRKNKVYQVSVTMQPAIEDENQAEQDVKRFVASEWEFAEGVTMAQNSMDEMMGEELGALGQALITAIFLIFIAMAIQFESPKYSLMIMITIPFSMIGAFGFLYLFDSPISMTSMLGFLMMVGNVVNAGILYVETVNEYRGTMPLEEALVEAGAVRMRPILETISITIISEIPNVFAYGESGTTMQGSSLVNVGGLISSTVLLLLMMPTFYRLVTKKPKSDELVPDD